MSVIFIYTRVSHFLYKIICFTIWVIIPYHGPQMRPTSPATCRRTPTRTGASLADRGHRALAGISFGRVLRTEPRHASGRLLGRPRPDAVRRPGTCAGSHPQAARRSAGSLPRQQPVPVPTGIRVRESHGVFPGRRRERLRSPHRRQKDKGMLASDGEFSRAARRTPGATLVGDGAEASSLFALLFASRADSCRRRLVRSPTRVGLCSRSGGDLPRSDGRRRRQATRCRRRLHHS